MRSTASAAISRCNTSTASFRPMARNWRRCRAKMPASSTASICCSPAMSIPIWSRNWPAASFSPAHPTRSPSRANGTETGLLTFRHSLLNWRSLAKTGRPGWGIQEHGMADAKPAAVAEPGLDLQKKFYRDMLLIRRFEEKAGQLYGMGLVGGFCHLYIGQEAVVVGMQLAISPGDEVITSYRDHGHMLACEMDPRGVMAELTGRSGGYSRGKGGSMHMFSKEKNFFGGHGIVGAQVSIGTGLGFS